MDMKLSLGRVATADVDNDTEPPVRSREREQASTRPVVPTLSFGRPLSVPSLAVAAPQPAGVNVGVVLTCPPLPITESDARAADIRDLTDVVAQHLGMRPEHLELFRVAGPGSGSGANPPLHLVARVQSDKMQVGYFTELLQENKSLQTKVEREAEALLTLHQQLTALQRALADAESRALLSPAQQPNSVPTAGRIGGLAGNPQVVAPSGSAMTSPRVTPQKKLESQNRVLQAEVEDLRGKLEKSEHFKREVLQTVKDLKRQLAVLTEEILLTDWDDDGGQNRVDVEE
eukprot:TRINITY_DN12555_c0_g1_i1.p1 TRINITY_DN12555_c0_g1~~TRINITY_DN12555_c0_g1_i1.p1  ORF type:complete len:288 (-),score=61.23 TRINITY_DN12555_c0_g1_i1:1-864(-)